MKHIFYFSKLLLFLYMYNIKKYFFLGGGYSIMFVSHDNYYPSTLANLCNQIHINLHSKLDLTCCLLKTDCDITQN